MEITGKIIAVLEPRKGTSSRTGSEWICGQYVLETMDQYPRKLFFEVFGADRMQQFNIQMGEIMTVSFDIDAREYQGRWYNGVRAFRVERNVQTAPVVTASVAPDTAPFGGAPVPTQAPATSAALVAEAAPFAPQTEGEDLPF
jgi:hypothetical protein